MKPLVGGQDAVWFDGDRGEHPGAYTPGAPVWEPGEGLDAFFPDLSGDRAADDDED